ncbi:MAG: hypothetical protein HOP28_07325 [Gemmatimonadales bacterium]|nr:hypothetical protein [Gemmatimonadales bacterium]
MRMPHVLVCSTAVLALVSACSKSDGPTDTTPKLYVQGVYRTTVSLVSSTCPASTLPQSETVVVHPAGELFVRVVNPWDTAYYGPLAANGAFALNERIDGTDTSVVVGSFTLTSIDATMTRRTSTTPKTPLDRCRIVLRWAGDKLGAPNVIP